MHHTPLFIQLFLYTMFHIFYYDLDDFGLWFFCFSEVLDIKPSSLLMLISKLLSCSLTQMFKIIYIYIIQTKFLISLCLFFIVLGIEPRTFEVSYNPQSSLPFFPPELSSKLLNCSEKAQACDLPKLSRVLVYLLYSFVGCFCQIITFHFGVIMTLLLLKEMSILLKNT